MKSIGCWFHVRPLKLWTKNHFRFWLVIGLTGIMQLTLSLAPAAHGQTLTDLSDEDRAALWGEFRNYLLSNPEILYELFDIIEAREEAQTAQNDAEIITQNREKLFNDPHSWQGGNLNGDVTIVEFMDYRCGYCREAHPVIQALLASDSDIRLIIKEFPILSDESRILAKITLASLKIGGAEAYEKIHNFLIDHTGDIDENDLEFFADVSSSELSDLVEIADSELVDQIIVDNHQLAETLGINGTPAFVIGDQIVRGYASLEVMQQLVAEARDRR